MSARPRRTMLFAKAPVPGRVKTRLARRVGAVAAAAMYQRLLRHTLATVAAAGTELELWCTPRQHPFLRQQARIHGARIRVQTPGDLGRRMHCALAGGLAAGRLPLIVGADCAALDFQRLDAAFAALEAGRDAVFVPAEDGGYALVGLSRPAAGIFRGIPWGGSRVMARTRRALARRGLDWVELPASFDIDDYADFRRWRRFRRR